MSRRRIAWPPPAPELPPDAALCALADAASASAEPVSAATRAAAAAASWAALLPPPLVRAVISRSRICCTSANWLIVRTR